MNLLLFTAVSEVAGSGCMWERGGSWDLRSRRAECWSASCHNKQHRESPGLQTRGRETDTVCENPFSDQHRHDSYIWCWFRAETEGAKATSGVWTSVYSSRQPALYPRRKRSPCEHSARVAAVCLTLVATGAVSDRLTDRPQVFLLYHIDMKRILLVEVEKTQINQIHTSLQWFVDVLVTSWWSQRCPLDGDVRLRWPALCVFICLDALRIIDTDAVDLITILNIHPKTRQIFHTSLGLPQFVFEETFWKYFNKKKKV